MLIQLAGKTKWAQECLRRIRGRGRKVSVSMGIKSGCKFVDSIFGREFETTKELMTEMRLWSMGFDSS